MEIINQEHHIVETTEPVYPPVKTEIERPTREIYKRVQKEYDEEQYSVEKTQLIVNTVVDYMNHQIGRAKMQHLFEPDTKIAYEKRSENEKIFEDQINSQKERFTQDCDLLLKRISSTLEQAKQKVFSGLDLYVRQYKASYQVFHNDSQDFLEEAKEVLSDQRGKLLTQFTHTVADVTGDQPLEEEIEIKERKATTEEIEETIDLITASRFGSGITQNGKTLTKLLEVSKCCISAKKFFENFSEKVEELCNFITNFDELKAVCPFKRLGGIKKKESWICVEREIIDAVDRTHVKKQVLAPVSPPQPVNVVHRTETIASPQEIIHSSNSPVLEQRTSVVRSPCKGNKEIKKTELISQVSDTKKSPGQRVHEIVSLGTPRHSNSRNLNQSDFYSQMPHQGFYNSFNMNGMNSFGYPQMYPVNPNQSFSRISNVRGNTSIDQTCQSTEKMVRRSVSPPNHFSIDNGYNSHIMLGSKPQIMNYQKSRLGHNVYERLKNSCNQNIRKPPGIDNTTKENVSPQSPNFGRKAF